MKASSKQCRTAGSSSALTISGSSDDYKGGSKVKRNLPQRLNPKIRFKELEPSAKALVASTTGSQKPSFFTGPHNSVPPALRSVYVSTTPPKTASLINQRSPVVDVLPDGNHVVTPIASSPPPGFKKVRICPLRLRRMAEIEVIYEGPNSAVLNQERAAIRHKREAAKAAFAAEKAKLHAAKAVSAIGIDSTRKSLNKKLVKTVNIVQPTGLGQLSLDSWLKKTPAGGFVAPPNPAAALLPAAVAPVTAKPSFYLVTPQLDRTQLFGNYIQAVQTQFPTGTIVVKSGTKRIKFLKKNARKYEDTRLFSVVLPRGALLTAVPKSGVQQQGNQSKLLDSAKIFILMSVVQFINGLRLACDCSRTKNFAFIKHLCSNLPDFDALCGFLCEISLVVDASQNSSFQRRETSALAPATISMELGRLLRLLLYLLIADEEEPDKIFNHSIQSLLVGDEILSFRFLRRLVKRQQAEEAEEASVRYQKEVKDNEGEPIEGRSPDDIDVSKWLNLDSYIEQLETNPNVTLWPAERVLGLLHALLVLVAQSATLNSVLEKLTEIMVKKRADVYLLTKEIAPLRKQLAARAFIVAAGSCAAATAEAPTKPTSKSVKFRESSAVAGDGLKQTKVDVTTLVSGVIPVVAPRRSVGPLASRDSSDPDAPAAAVPAVTAPNAADERATIALSRKLQELIERQQRLQLDLDEAESAVDGMRGAVHLLGFDRNQSAYFTLLDGGGTVFVSLNNYAADQFFAPPLAAPAAGSELNSFIKFYAQHYGATRVHLNVVDEAHPDDLREILCRYKNKTTYAVNSSPCAIDRVKPLPRTVTMLEMSNLCCNTLSSNIIKYSGIDQIKALHASLNFMGARESQLKRLLHEYTIKQWPDAAAAEQQVNKVVDADGTVVADEDEHTIEAAEAGEAKAGGTHKKRIRPKIDYRLSMFNAPDFSRPDNNTTNDADKISVNVGRLEDVWTKIATMANNMYERARTQYAFFNDVNTAISSGSCAAQHASSLKANKKKMKALRFAQAAVWLVEPDVSAAQLVDASTTATSVGYALIDALVEYADALRVDYITEFGRQCIRYIKTHRAEILGNGEQSAWLHLYLIFKLFENEGINIPDTVTMRTRQKRRNYDEASISGSSDASSSRASRQKLLESYDSLFHNILNDPRMEGAPADEAVASVVDEQGEEEDFEAEAVMRQVSVDDVKGDADYRVDDSDDDFYRRKKQKKGADSSKASSHRSSRAGSSSGRSAVQVDPAAIAAANSKRQQAEREARRNKRVAHDDVQSQAERPGKEGGKHVKRARREESSPSTSTGSLSIESGRSDGSRRVLRGFAVQKKTVLESVEEINEGGEELDAAEIEDETIMSSTVRRRLRSSNQPPAASSSAKHRRDNEADEDERRQTADRANDSGSSAGKRNNVDESDNSSIEELPQQPRSSLGSKSSSGRRFAIKQSHRRA